MKIKNSIAVLLVFFMIVPAYAQDKSTSSTAPAAQAATSSPALSGSALASPVAVPSTTGPQSASKDAPTVVGHVVWVKGDFTAVAPDKTQRVLKRASDIYAHDTLITGDKSQAQIVFTDNSLMAFQPKTTFQITNYHFEPSKPTAANSKYTMDLVAGGFRTVTGWVGKSQPKNYKIKTPVATLGVRGTDFSVFYDPNASRKLEVQLKVGSIEISNSGGVTELNVQTKQLYAEVNNAAQAATIVSTPSIVFQRDPTIIPAVFTGTPAVPAVAATIRQPESNVQNNNLATPPTNTGGGGGSTGTGTGGETTAAPSTNGTGTEGSTTEGSTTEGSTTEGSTTAGGTTEGSTTEGSTTAGSTTEGSTTAGSTTAGSTTAGSSTTGPATGTTTTSTGVGTSAIPSSAVPTPPKGPVDSFCIQ